MSADGPAPRRRFTSDDKLAELRRQVINARYYELEMLEKHGAGSRQHNEAIELVNELAELYREEAARPKLVEDLGQERSCLGTFAVLVGGYGVDPVTAAAHVRGEGGRS